MSSDSDISNIIKRFEIKETGSIHPINQLKYEIFDLLNSLGFSIIDGPEVESEKYNFDLLNIKESHPARQMHDTFYVEEKEYLLRTHTSPVQVRAMLREKPHLHIYLGERFTERMMTLHIYQCFIRLREY